MKSPRASAAPSPSAAAKTGGSVQWGLMLLLVATLSPTSPVRTTSHLHDLATVDTVMPSSYANYRGGASHQPQYDRYAEAAAFFDVEFASADPQPNSKSDKKQSTAEDADGASSSTGTPHFPSRLARQRARKLQRRRRSTSAAQDDDSESDGTAYDEDDLMPIDDCSISVSTCNLSGPESTVDERAATESPIEDSSLIRTSSVSATSPAALVHAMTFLPLDALDVARDGVADELSMAVDFVAPRPIAGAPGAVFVRIAMNANASSRPSLDDKSLQGLSRRAKLAAVRGEASFEWRCLHCGSLSDNRKKCSTCSAEIAHAACRVFMGQLCKDATAEVTAYMLRSLAPEVHIRHIESHTNGRDGRGKGCAWIYLDKVADAKKLTELHKRIFLDVDCDNFQGFWYVKDASLMPNLAAMSDVVGALPERPSALPRHPLVVEWQHNEAKVA